MQLVGEYRSWVEQQLKASDVASVAVLYASAYGNTSALAQVCVFRFLLSCRLKHSNTNVCGCAVCHSCVSASVQARCVCMCGLRVCVYVCVCVCVCVCVWLP